MKNLLQIFIFIAVGLISACSLQSQPAQMTFAISGAMYGELEPCG